MANLNLEEALRRKSMSFPLKSYLWRVVLPDLTQWHHGYEFVPHKKPQMIGGFGGHMLDLDHRITTITSPFVTMETDKVIAGNSYWYQAKHNDIGNITMEIQEFEDGLTLNYLNAWMDLISNADGTYNPPVFYKRDIIVYRLSSTKEDLIKHTYKNYFISGISDISSEYGSSDIMKYSAQFTGDSVISETMKIASLQEKPEEQEIIKEELRLKKKFRGLGGGVLNRVTKNIVNTMIDKIGGAP